MSRRDPGWGAIAVIVSVGLWHAVAGALVGLGDAESLYWCYGAHLAGGYLDHPPLIGWLVAASTAVFGDRPAAVRLVPTVCHALTLLGAWTLALEIFRSRRVAARAVFALLLVPMVTIGGIAAAPDAPASAAWIWSCVALDRALRRYRASGASRPLDGVVVGGLLGLTFLAKYTGVLLVVAAVLVLLRREHRGLWRRPAPWIAATCCLLVVSPVIWWNATHGWVSVLHRFVWSQRDAGPSWALLGAAVGGQVAYLGPPMLAALLWTLAALARRRGRADLSLLWLASVLPLSFTWALCLVSPAAEPHWPAQGYLALAVAAAGLGTGPWRGRARAWRRAVIAAAVAVLALSMLVLHLLVFTTLWPDLAGEARYEPRHDLTNELMGWPEVAREVAAVMSEGEPIVGSHWVICGQLAFSLAGQAGREGAEVRCVTDETDDFDLWGLGGVGDGPCLYVEDDRFGRPVAEVFPGRPAVEVGRVDLRRGRWTVRRFRLFRVSARR